MTAPIVYNISSDELRLNVKFVLVRMPIIPTTNRDFLPTAVKLSNSMDWFENRYNCCSKSLSSNVEGSPQQE